MLLMDSQQDIGARDTHETSFIEQIRLPVGLIECTPTIITAHKGEAFRLGRLDSELIKAQRGLD